MVCEWVCVRMQWGVCVRECDAVCVAGCVCGRVWMCEWWVHECVGAQVTKCGGGCVYLRTGVSRCVHEWVGVCLSEKQMMDSVCKVSGCLMYFETRQHWFLQLCLMRRGNCSATTSCSSEEQTMQNFENSEEIRFWLVLKEELQIWILFLFKFSLMTMCWRATSRFSLSAEPLVEVVQDLHGPGPVCDLRLPSPCDWVGAAPDGGFPTDKWQTHKTLTTCINNTTRNFGLFHFSLRIAVWFENRVLAEETGFSLTGEMAQVGRVSVTVLCVGDCTLHKQQRKSVFGFQPQPQYNLWNKNTTDKAQS